MKAKGIDILILMIYAYAVQQPEHDWYMQTDKDTFVSIRNIYEQFDSTTWLMLPQLHAVAGCDRVSYFFNVSKWLVFERTSSGITTFNMIVELGSSNITAKVSKLWSGKIYSQSLFYRSKEVEGINETRTKQDNEIKTKTKET